MAHYKSKKIKPVPTIKAALCNKNRSSICRTRCLVTVKLINAIKKVKTI